MHCALVLWLARTRQLPPLGARAVQALTGGACRLAGLLKQAGYPRPPWRIVLWLWALPCQGRGAGTCDILIFANQAVAELIQERDRCAFKYCGGHNRGHTAGIAFLISCAPLCQCRTACTASWPGRTPCALLQASAPAGPRGCAHAAVERAGSQLSPHTAYRPAASCSPRRPCSASAAWAARWRLPVPWRLLRRRRVPCRSA